MIFTNDIEVAKDALLQDNLVAIPTETVYGLAGNAFSEVAVLTIFAFKKRPAYNPLIVHIKSAAYLTEIAKDIPPNALKLAEHFWPGPLALVLQKKDCIPNCVTGGKDTVAVRVPDHPLTLQLLHALDFPIAAPSANPFGSISPTAASHVQKYFLDEVGVILDGGNCKKGVESTIIGFENNRPVLYRHGALAIEDIERVVGQVSVQTKNEIAPAAPGMLSRHYSPSTNLCLTENLAEAIESFKGQKIGLLLFNNEFSSADVSCQKILAANGDLEEAAKGLYQAMHHLDTLELDIILAERFPNNGLGKTINDRLERASKKK